MADRFKPPRGRSFNGPKLTVIGGTPPADHLKSYFEPRGLDPAELGCQYITATKASEYLGFKPEQPGILIPYGDLLERPLMDGTLQFMRFRFWPVLPSNGQKYAQGKKTGVHAYLSPGVPWPKVAAAPNLARLFTEGEFKAAKVNKTPGFPPCIGIGGVNSFGSARLAPELEEFDWRGCTVYVCFDSDIHHKPEVQAALARICGTLEGYGAKIKVLDIAKTNRLDANGVLVKGIDDYILAGGTWEELVATETEGIGTPLAYMLSGYALVKGKYVVDTLTGEMLTLKDFHEDKKNVLMPGTEKPALVSRIWQSHRSRINVESLTVDPAQKPGMLKVFESADKFKWYFNVWKGFQTEPERIDELYDAVVSRWKHFVLTLFNGDQGLAELFHRWVAWIWHNPSKRNQTSWVLMSPKEGVGKSVLGEVVAAAMGVGKGMGARINVGADDLFSKYPDYAHGTVFMVCDEIRDSWDRHRAKMKELRTADLLRVEVKGTQAYLVSNYLNLIITTNEPFAYGMSETARRDIVVEACKGMSFQEAEDWKKWVKYEIGPMRDRPDTLKCLTYWWMNEIDLKDYDPREDAPYTEAKAMMARASDGSIAEVKDAVDDLIEKWGGKGVIPTPWIRPEYKRLHPEVESRWIIFCREVGIRAGYTAVMDRRKVKVDGVAMNCIIFAASEAEANAMDKPAELKRSRELLGFK